MRRLLYVCLDGLGDDPIPEIGNRTPLEAAETPFLDSLAARGRTGNVFTVAPGVAPESDPGVRGMLGYAPREEHTGRGVLEAVGSGMAFHDGDLAYRINFATAEWPDIVDRRVGRDLTSEEAEALADKVNRELRLPNAAFELRATVEHRGALVIRSEAGPLSANVSNTDPAYAREGHLGVALETFEARVAHAEPLDDSPEARTAAELTNAFVEGSARILDRSAVNGRRRMGSTPCTCTSRAPTSRPTTAGPRTSGTSSRPSTAPSSARCSSASTCTTRWWRSPPTIRPRACGRHTR